MNLAAIDVGTNAVLLLIMERNGASAFREVLDTSTITRLGEGLIGTGRLAPAAMERTVRALESYRQIIDSHGARLVCCFGTSALREAKDRDEFIRLARERAGMDVRVFSEYAEAYYTYLSVKDDCIISGERTAADNASVNGETATVDGVSGDGTSADRASLVIVDIGGGSTEITRATRRDFIDYVSVPVGTVKLTELFVRHDPPLSEELEELRLFVRSKLPACEVEGRPTIVGMAGTMTTLAAIILGLDEFDKARIHGMTVSLDLLDEWIGRLAPMSIQERKAIPGMEPGREDLLLQGMILMREIVAAHRGKEFVVSTYGARYGVLYEDSEK